MKRWHVTMVSGSSVDIERELQKIEDSDGSIVGVTANTGPYPAWTVFWTKYEEHQEEA